MVEHAEKLRNPAGPAFDNAAAQFREAHEYAVIDHGRKEFLRCEPQAQEIREAEVLAAAVEICRPVTSIVLELGRLGFRAWPDMQHERDTAILQELPERVQIWMARALVARRTRTEHYRLRASADRPLCFRQGPIGIVKRREGDTVHPGIGIAEILLRLVEGGCRGISLIVIRGLGDRSQAECRKYQLAVEPQPVERLHTLILVETAVTQPALGSFDGIFQRLCPRFGIVLTGLGRVDHLDDAVAAFPLGIYLRIHLLVLAFQIGGQPVLGFHGVGIGVVDDSSGGVRHACLLNIWHAYLTLFVSSSNALWKLMSRRSPKMPGEFRA